MKAPVVLAVAAALAALPPAVQGQPPSATRESCAFYADAARRLGDPTLRMPSNRCLDLTVREWKGVIAARKPTDPLISAPRALATFDACASLSFSGLCSNRTPSGLLYVWAGDADGEHPDFLAVIDADPTSAEYGSLLATVPVEGRRNIPHHTEYELAGRTLFASGWGKGRTFIFDLSSPELPYVSGDFTMRGEYGYPHSYARLANGNVLAVFQSAGPGYSPPGALVEMGPTGELLRASSAATPDIPADETWPYSLLVLPEIDRVVTTSTRMGTLEEWLAAEEARKTGHTHESPDRQTTQLQLWRLSDLSLVGTVLLPPQDGGFNGWPAEPRRLASGDVYVNTFSCGLYRLEGLDSDAPRAVGVGSIQRPIGDEMCAVPVVIGNYWIQPEPGRAIVVYDLGDRSRAREASRLVLDDRYSGAHWIAADPLASRLVVTSEDGWVLLLDFDPVTGGVSIDQRFRDRGADSPGMSFHRDVWPHGAGGHARPHGAVFGARR
jgi:hypothetical protein